MILKVSLPAQPIKVSLPPKPLNVSLPAPPISTSSPEVPFKVKPSVEVDWKSIAVILETATPEIVAR